ncbi:tetraacyldisaccharide 4'-kinase [Hyphomicrobium sp.]|uniref:tetraacyldisaccharide 4'-kinase n=1 Tax=Hyphomicrobium sp. TaxID=82 RepID=UPI002CEDAEEA|nr:tetraacyldisaccharide 4'-kinase [Hyphomicrobium sp.]HVZ03454.1 tetraacyldisaccharide 4'-kinase [Hyphomicrobium sp.]
MPGREPKWWYGAQQHWQAILLSPAGRLAGTIAAARLAKSPSYRSRLPVICIGNFTVGGSGKTPLAMLIAKLVSEEGWAPWFLSRGYGGRIAGPIRVDPNAHSSDEVGDEPLLLARHAPIFVSRDRCAGAKAIEAVAPDNGVIIMDDGLQNPYLAKDLVIAVVSGERGFGNGLVIPAGPLRAPLRAQIGLADIIVVAKQSSRENLELFDVLRARTQAPIVSATTRPAGNAAHLRGRRVVAYAGIANPDRFFSMLENLGAFVIERRAFPDHHTFAASEARALTDMARRLSADLVTTEKDLMRLSGMKDACGDLRDHSIALGIETAMEGKDLAVLKNKIREAVARYCPRSSGRSLSSR